jgi:flagellar biogenesis protein FliO
MMQSTFHLMLALALVLFVVSLVVSETRVVSWPAPPAALGSAFLFLIGSIQASSIQVVTDTGTTTVSEPTIGIISGIMGVLAFILALVMTVRWFPIAGEQYGTR